jgi:hypothetical protein
MEPENTQNPYRSPEASTPSISVDTATPLVKRLRRKSGDDQIWCAAIATIFGWFIPFGFVLDAVSLFFVIRTFTSKSKPGALAVVIGVLVGLWNVFRLLWVFLAVALPLLAVG